MKLKGLSWHVVVFGSAAALAVVCRFGPAVFASAMAIFTAVFSGGAVLGYMFGHRHGREPRSMEARIVRDELPGNVQAHGRREHVSVLTPGLIAEGNALARLREENGLLDAWRIAHRKELRMLDEFHRTFGSVADEYWKQYKEAGCQAADLLGQLLDRGIDPLAKK